ncbi:MAG: helical backbone metal receptor [Kiritimatiellae bacterium]|nr:helical backbone metal receptor [Kiritimatiellia bacterium]
MQQDEFSVLRGNESPQRIISLAPSITETLFALDLGDRVVGVSAFCRYPDAVSELPRVGDFFNPNVEAIIRLKPDLVILLNSSADFYERLKRLQVPALMVRQESVEDVLDSFVKIGEACGVAERGVKLADSMREALADGMMDERAEEERPTVLIAVGHEPGPDGYQQVFLAGRDGFYDRLVRAAGGRNVYDGPVPYPQISREGLLRLNPEIILDIAPDLDKRGLTRESIVEQWRKTGSQLPAVEKGRVVVLDQTYISVPGPRIPLLWNDVKGAVQGHE